MALNSASTPARIFTSDLLIVDHVISMEQVPPDARGDIQTWLSAHNVQPKKKISIGKEDFEELRRILERHGVEEHHMTKVPGGSSANTVTTLTKLMGPLRVRSRFLGAAGDDADSTLIKQGLREASVELMPNDLRATTGLVESATSFVFVWPGGERSIVTYPGNAKEVLKSYMVTPAMGESGVIIVQGSLWDKLGETRRVKEGHADGYDLGIADAILKNRWKNGNDLVLALPTQADFSTSVTHTDGEVKPVSHSEKAAHFRSLIQSANVVLGNGEELSRVYTTADEHQAIDAAVKTALGGHAMPDDREELRTLLGAQFDVLNAKWDVVNNSIHAKDALPRLQNDLKKDFLQTASQNQEDEWSGERSQVAFVTLGREGCVVVDKHHISDVIPPAPIDKGQIKNKLGAGDAAFAGFLAGYLLLRSHQHQHPNISYEDCAKLGMLMARANLREEGARVSDPVRAIREALPELTDRPELQQALQEILHTRNVVMRGSGQTSDAMFR